MVRGFSRLRQSGKMFICALGAAGPMLTTAPALALSEADFLGDMPLVLSASRLLQPKDEAPAAITVIDRELIEASTALEVTDLLRLVPGFQVAQVSGWERSVTSHGIADQHGRRMQVLIDGRSVYDPIFGGMVWQSIPLSIADVERIEVVRGPNAASYGSNAFLGAINIVTKKPTGSGETQARMVAGSQQSGYLDVARDWQLDGRKALRLSAGAVTQGGFDGRRDGGRSARFNARFVSHPNPGDEIELLAGASKTRLEAGFPLDPIQPLRDADYLSHYQQLRFQRTHADGSDLSLQLYHNHQERDDRYDVVGLAWPPFPTYLDHGFQGDRWDAELEWRTSFGADTRLVYGAGWRLDDGSVPHGITPDADGTRQQWRLFAHGEHRLSPDWLLQGGLMLEELEDVGRYASPRISLTRKLAPRQSLRFSAARGHRLPSLFEQYAFFGLFASADDSPVYYPNGTFPYTSSADIKPETIDAYEIGLVGELDVARLSYDVKLFAHRMRNLIDTAQFTNSTWGITNWEFRNIGEMDIHGLELQLSARPTPRTLAHLVYSLAEPDGIAWKDYPDGILSPVPRNLNPLVPRHTLGLLLNHRFDAGVSASASLVHVSEMTWGGDGDALAGFTRLDLKLGKSMRIPGADLKLELVVHNALNQPYDEFLEPRSNHPGNVFDRRVYGQLSVTHR